MLHISSNTNTFAKHILFFINAQCNRRKDKKSLQATATYNAKICACLTRRNIGHTEALNLCSYNHAQH